MLRATRYAAHITACLEGGSSCAHHSLHKHAEDDGNRDTESCVEQPFRATFVARNRWAWVKRDQYSADKLSCVQSA